MRLNLWVGFLSPEVRAGDQLQVLYLAPGMNAALVSSDAKSYSDAKSLGSIKLFPCTKSSSFTMCSLAPKLFLTILRMKCFAVF